MLQSGVLLLSMNGETSHRGFLRKEGFLLLLTQVNSYKVLMLGFSDSESKRLCSRLPNILTVMIKLVSRVLCFACCSSEWYF